MLQLRNLGKIATVLNNLVNGDAEAHADVDAFDAPGECHDIVSKGFVRECNEVVADIEKATGYTAEELLAQFNQRVSGKWLWQRGITAPLSIVIDGREEKEERRQRFQYFNNAKLV